jgi:cyclopropane fatty-acyl-phospholipid synthase-like methyltransferase
MPLPAGPPPGDAARMADPAHFQFDEVFDAEEYLYFYEDTLREEDTPRQVDFVARELGLAPGARVVDLGCGHGRHANELARRGHQVLGVDLVLGFLERARAEARAEGLAVDYALGDVRGLGMVEAFDHAISLFDAFGFLDDEGNAAWLRAAAQALVPGGSLLLDVRNRDWIVRNILPFTVLDKGDDLMIDRHLFDTATGRLVDRRTYVRAGHARTVRFSIRLYTLTELTALLDAAGLTVDRAWGGWDGTPVSMARNRMIVRARKA